MRRAAQVVASALCLALASFGCGDSGGAGPSISLVGEWDFIGFSDTGVEATTTGTVVFRSNGTLSWIGTVTFPSQPTDSIVLEGTYQQTASSVVLTFGLEPSTTWSLSLTGDILLLTAVGPPPANTIRLRRR